jgi:hypothetical protein
VAGSTPGIDGRVSARRPRRTVAFALAVGLSPLIAGAAGAASISLARFTDTTTATKTITTDTLDPPTALSATGGTTAVSLAWTPTVDTYAAGYEVRRATVSGGPYTTVATVTPRAAANTTNTPPANGTYFYVLRSYFQSWLSASTAEVSAGVGQTASGYHGCTTASNAPETTGDGDGYESLAANACAAGGGIATDANTGTNTNLSCTDAGKDAHRFWDFGLGVPATASSIVGIQVRADVGQNNNSGTSWVCVQLSWDGGTSWTAAKSATVASVGTTTYTLGGAADTWGRTWTGPQLSNASFRLRVIDVSDRASKDIRLDYLAVQVTYVP